MKKLLIEGANCNDLALNVLREIRILGGDIVSHRKVNSAGLYEIWYNGCEEEDFDYLDHLDCMIARINPLRGIAADYDGDFDGDAIVANFNRDFGHFFTADAEL